MLGAQWGMYTAERQLCYLNAISKPALVAAASCRGPPTLLSEHPRQSATASAETFVQARLPRSKPCVHALIYDQTSWADKHAATH